MKPNVHIQWKDFCEWNEFDHWNTKSVLKCTFQPHSFVYSTRQRHI